MVAQEKSSKMLLICLKNSKSEFGRGSNLKMLKRLYKPYFPKKEMVEFY